MYSKSVVCECFEPSRAYFFFMFALMIIFDRNHFYDGDTCLIFDASDSI